MSRKELSLSVKNIQPFDLESLREKAAEMNRRHMETFNTPFPNRGIYLTQPSPRGCGSVSEAKGTGDTCTACWANR